MLDRAFWRDSHHDFVVDADHGRGLSTWRTDATPYLCAWSSKVMVDATATIRWSLLIAFRSSGFVPALRWPTISSRSRLISPMLSFMARLLRNLDRLLWSGFSWNGFLLWHHSRIRNHFRDVDRL